MNKVSILFCLPNVAGGVESVLNNLNAYKTDKENVSILAYKPIEDKRPSLREASFLDIKRNVLTYSSLDKFSIVRKKIEQVIKKEKTDVIIASDVVELDTINSLKINKPVVFIVMGDFEHYYQLATLYQGIINHFIAISNEIEEYLRLILPNRLKDISKTYCPLPVQMESNKTTKQARTESFIWVGRLEEAKNPLLLFEIDSYLRNQGRYVNWTIVGDGPLMGECLEICKTRAMSNFTFTGSLSQSELRKEYLKHSYFIMTSSSEGLPVSLLEAVQAELIPIVSDISGGVRDVVKHNENGFLCKEKDAKEFAEKIQTLFTDPTIKNRMRDSSKEMMNTQFNSAENATKYYCLFREAALSPKKKEYTVLSGNRLDNTVLPNILVRQIRRIIQIRKRC